ncbi:MAG: DegV family protein [Anaerolineaceae bacterium]|nr:DegV family protein [Anaerolineaceae bacterium]
MSKIAIVTDSGAYLPSEITDEYGIHVIPLQLAWDEDTYNDGVDILPSEFYGRLEKSETIPTTSQPSPATFKDVYSNLLEKDFQILSVHISSKLSGTVDSAIQAKNMLGDAPIEVVDTLSTALDQGLHVLTAARAAAGGASLQECKAITLNARANSGIFFVVATLEYLRRGGRIGGASALLGNALNLKPILTLVDGSIEAAAKVRTTKKAVERMLDMVEARIAGKNTLRLGVIHANAPESAQRLMEQAVEKFKDYNIVDKIIAGVSPAIGTHVGPGTVGLAFLTDV